MIRYLWIVNGFVFEGGRHGAWRCYTGEAARVMALVLRHSGPRP